MLNLVTSSEPVPFYGHGRTPPDPAWGAAFTLLADWVATYYADEDIFARHYNGLKMHTESLITTAKVCFLHSLSLPFDFI